MLQVIGIIGECTKDINMLAYLKDKAQKILLYETESELYEPLIHVSEIELLIVSSEIDINKSHPIIDKAKKHDIQILSNIDLIYMFKKPKTIAITGSYSMQIVGNMIAHVLSKCGVEHYMSLSEVFKWPNNLDTVEWMVICLQNYQLKSLDLFYANVTCVTNVASAKLDGKHIQEYLANIKHLLELSQYKIINTDSESSALLKYFDDALTSETDITADMIARYADCDYTSEEDHETVLEWRKNPLKMKLALLTATTLQSIAKDLPDSSYMFVRALNALYKFRMHGHMQILFQNDELTIIDDAKAHSVDQVMYDIGLLPDDANVLLICPEPKNIDDWLKLKKKGCIEKLYGLVLYDVIESVFMIKMQFATRSINAISIEQACDQLVKMFNKIKKRPLIIMFVHGTDEQSKIFQKHMDEYVQEEYVVAEDEEFMDWS